ncbi:MAG: DUF2508 family protein [Eubacteriaceae bacterium]|nr:DUF2508 family protein [Eubacteriaceae bacterium]
MRAKTMTENQMIIDSIRNARNEVEDATRLFNELTDTSAIDYASYNLLAAKTKYSYLIQIAKEKGMSV